MDVGFRVVLAPAGWRATHQNRDTKRNEQLTIAPGILRERVVVRSPTSTRYAMFPCSAEVRGAGPIVRAYITSKIYTPVLPSTAH